MAGQDGDPYGSAKKTTQHEGQGRRGARGSRARSAWAVVLAAIFLIGLGAWVLSRPHSGTDPALGGSPGNGVATESAPSSGGN
jgi:hypothetical protein